ncbi:hypothetical protein BVRB_1g022590 [Beta vulgaris subsp. vulgaris]|nr:hypothetical protein BVRB_1g022590 [Beta vulgaris subsp. vulgaris]
MVTARICSTEYSTDEQDAVCRYMPFLAAANLSCDH